MRRMRLLVLLLFTIGVFSARPAEAQDHKLKIFGGLSYISPLSDDDVDIGGITDSIEASDELGWTAGVEFRFNKFFGLELDAIHATHDLEFGGDTIGEVDFTPLSASLNFHLIHTTIVDFYVAPTASYIIWGDIEFDDDPDEDGENEFAYGAQVGLDIGFGETFAIFGGVRWLNSDLEPEDGDEDLGVDPLFTRLGVAFRF